MMMDVIQGGVVGDGTTLNTIAIQRLIDGCAAAGGGAIYFPPGRYLTGTIQIRSNVVLRLAEGALILGSTDASDYRNLDPFIDGSGNPMGHALIVAVDAMNVGIEGRGTIDGQGSELKARQNPYVMRPFLIRWVKCTNVAVRGVRLTGPGAWTLNFCQTKHAVVEDLTIRCRGTGLHNNDGINIDSSEYIEVRNCDILSGDDALVIKSTCRERLSRHISASNCMLSTRTNAIKIGTESIGGFEHITISNVRIFDTQMAGIALYAVDGGDLCHVKISDVHMEDVMVPISIRLGKRLKTFRHGQKSKTQVGKLSDVVIRNVTTKYVGMIGVLINGVPGHAVENVTIENIRLELPGGGTELEAAVQLPECEADYPEFDTFGKIMPAYGIYARHVRGLELKNISKHLAKPDARPAMVLIDAEPDRPVLTHTIKAAAILHQRASVTNTAN